MKVRAARFLMLVSLVVIVFGGGYALGQSGLAPVDLTRTSTALSEETTEAFRPFWETFELLQEEYFKQPLDDTELAEGAIDGLLATLDDPNTRYLSPQQELAEREAMEGNLEGIGAEITAVDGAITIVAPYEGSPAELAGILPGDILREADGHPLTDLPPSEAATLVRGPSGTPVNLVIERDGKLLEIEVVRGIIKIPSVRGELLDENIVYIRLSRFANNTNQELTDLLNDLSDDEPVGIILDLRANPGGSLTTAVDVADHFLEKGTILTESFGNGEEVLFEADDEGDAQEHPMVVLIDGGSASASEVIAGAIQDRDRGVLIGDTTSGKGTVQVWKRLSNGGGIRITIARWLTPDGDWVHGEGLDPDFFVSLAESGDDEFNDNQLQAAVDYLLGRPVLETKAADKG